MSPLAKFLVERSQTPRPLHFDIITGHVLKEVANVDFVGQGNDHAASVGHLFDSKVVGSNTLANTRKIEDTVGRTNDHTENKLKRTGGNSENKFQTIFMVRAKRTIVQAKTIRFWQNTKVAPAMFAESSGSTRRKINMKTLILITNKGDNLNLVVCIFQLTIGMRAHELGHEHAKIMVDKTR